MIMKRLLIGTMILSLAVSSVLTTSRVTATTINSTDNITVKPTVTPTPKPITPKSFTDVKKGSTYYTAVTALAKKGCLGGYSNGTFKPKSKITNGQFICILVRAIDNEVARAVIGYDFDKDLIEIAIDHDILEYGELTAATYSKNLTRGNMALWTARALMAYEGVDCLEEIYNIDNLITDYSSIPEKYKESAIGLYSEGIFTSAKFNHSGAVSRGTAVNTILKVVDAEYRKDMSKVTIPNDQEAAQNQEAVTLKWNDPNRPLAKAGDVFLTKDGKKVKLTALEYGDIVVGYGQKLDLYSGMKYGDRTFKPGDLGGTWGENSTFSGQPYTIAKNGEGHFRSEWRTIAAYEETLTEKVKNPKDGQIVGYWTQYRTKYDSWVWVGPVY